MAKYGSIVFIDDGINRNEAVNVYPNPVTNLLQVKLPNGVQLEKIVVNSVSGQQLQTSNQTTLELSKLPSGLYFLTIETNQGVITKKMIKN